MSLDQYKVVSQDERYRRVQRTEGDTLTGTVAENKKVFDDYPDYIGEQHNALIDHITPNNVGAVPATNAQISSVYPYASDVVKIGIEGTHSVDNKEYLFGAKATCPYLYDDTNNNIIWEGYTTLKKPTPADVGAVPNTRAGVNGAINLLEEGTSNSAMADFILTQYAGGGSSNTTYYRRPLNKVLTSSNIASALGYTPVPTTRTVNSKALSSNITLSSSDVGAVPSTYGNIENVVPYGLTGHLIGIAGKNTNTGINKRYSFGATATAPALYNDTDNTPVWTGYTNLNKPTPADIGAVPTTRTVNGKALSSNITLSASDVGASTTIASEVSFSGTLTSSSQSTVKYVNLPSGKNYIVVAQVSFDTGETAGDGLIRLFLTTADGTVIPHTAVSGVPAYLSGQGYLGELQTVGLVAGGSTVRVRVSSANSNTTYQGSIIYMALGV